MDEYYIVKIKRPREVTVGQMEYYIDQAVGSWKGSMSPDDPIFDLDDKSVVVRKLTVRRANKALEGTL